MRSDPKSPPTPETGCSFSLITMGTDPDPVLTRLPGTVEEGLVARPVPPNRWCCMSLAVDSASEAELSFEDENFRLRLLLFAGGSGASDDTRLRERSRSLSPRLSLGLSLRDESFDMWDGGRGGRRGGGSGIWGEGRCEGGSRRGGGAEVVGVVTTLRRLCLYFCRIIFLKWTWQ